jgi:biotin-dependent carboxylase-like uncharacterized protein
MLKVIKAGVLSTIQDMGRHGFRHFGVSQSGVIDPFALKAGNLLLENDESAPCIEITVGLAEFQFTMPCHFAITGGNLNASLNNDCLHTGWRYTASAGDVLKFNSHAHFLRAYLCVEGGFGIDDVMSSKSTDLHAQFGGIHGRALQNEDVIFYPPATTTQPPLAIQQPQYDNVVRVLKGPHCDILPNEYLLRLLSQTWTVSDLSNRMGVRLTNESPLTHSKAIRSQGVHPGVIQLPPTGSPIVLLNDCQTTGGYPIIASVIQADIRHFSQLSSGQTCHFKLVDNKEAIQQLAKQNMYLTRFEIAKKHMKNKK